MSSKCWILLRLLIRTAHIESYWPTVECPAAGGCLGMLELFGQELLTWPCRKGPKKIEH